MWWLRSRSADDRGGASRSPLVLAVTQPVTRKTAPELVRRISRLAAGSPVVVDLSGITAFDSDGTAALTELQGELGADRLTLVGLRHAADRLLAVEEERPQPGSSVWVVRRLHAIAVVQPDRDGPVTTQGMDRMLTEAFDGGPKIVVLDLRGVTLGTGDVQTVADASSAAAVRGVDLLVVNIDDEAGERLRSAGLSATTFVAPEALPGG